MQSENSKHGGEKRPFHIAVNAHLLSGEAGYRRAGIHHYIAQVLSHLPQNADSKYTIFTRWGNDLPQRDDFIVQGSRWPTERRSVRILWEQMVWPWQSRKLDLMHSMAFVTPLIKPCPTVVTVYDLSFLHFPERFPALQRWYLTSQTKRSCRAANRVITISESSRQDVHQFFDVPLSQIDVVVPGVNGRYQPLPPEQINTFRQTHNLPARFILHVGTLQPRKNIPILLEALAKLADKEIQLVLAGGKGWLYDEIFAQIEALGLVDRVIFPGYVADEDLPLWYNAASLFAFPSVYEGFGMPVVEAMACGTPVVASTASSIPEAVGSAGLLFNPYDAAELAERIASVLGDSDLSATMRTKGLQHARLFSWEEAGRKTAVIYHQLINDKK
ncbi:MAG: glycosyltransferase family 4 protein [Anaerolineae bacterium]|nr:glycosyltransferase family 4 protein [Anaerolineae bacterium]